MSVQAADRAEAADQVMAQYLWYIVEVAQQAAQPTSSGTLITHSISMVIAYIAFTHQLTKSHLITHTQSLADNTLHSHNTQHSNSYST